ncbi:ABC transporter substrate-binding protein [Brevundimonas sp.]|uniref:ABC transporter substrate-binding protein n=2 Tax=Brevundimonas sp. TaxID=1871086 RepID=UPI002FC6BDC2
MSLGLAMRTGLGLAVVGLACFPAQTSWSAPVRVMSLDQCADQYVLALSPEAEVRLSPRADDPDAYMREAAKDYRRIRPTLEAAVAFRPDVVVRYWGGDMRLLSRLEADGVTVATIADSQDFEGIRQNIRNVSQALGAEARGDDLIRQMDAKLQASQGAGQGHSATYLTASGFTAGPETLIDSVLRAAGFRNGTRATGYQPLGLERALLRPPMLFVRGFFEQRMADWRGTGRHPVLKKLMQKRTVADLPAATLTCPAWFAADAVETLAKAGQ